MSRILMIDDEEDICFFTKQNLGAAGYEVTCATNPDEGIKLAQRNPPDVILLDITMPKTDGFSVLKALKKHPRTMAIPVIMMTAVETDAAKLKASQMYCEDYLNKPVAAETLKNAVREVLQRNKGERVNDMGYLKKILIIDDEESVGVVVKRNLEHTGEFSVFIAQNGQDGLALARLEKPDLILLDVMMPGMDGQEVAKALSQENATGAIPIIFLTAIVTSSDVGGQAMADIGGHHYVSKPVSAADLIACIKKVLEGLSDAG